MAIEVVTGQDPSRLKSLRLSALKDTPEAFGAKHEDELLFSDTHWQERMVNTQWCFVVADGVDVVVVDPADAGLQACGHAVAACAVAGEYACGQPEAGVVGAA